MNLLSIFAGGLIIIPFITLLGALIFGYQAYKAHNSNSTTANKTGRYDNTGNVPYTSIGQFWFSVALFIATAVIIWAMYNDK
jgi:hypothetical protein